MAPLSYKNIEKQENDEIFSDPENDESDSSDKEELIDEAEFNAEAAKLQAIEFKKKDKFEGMFDEDELLKNKQQLLGKKAEKKKPEPESDSDEYESSSSEEAPRKDSKPVDKRDIFAESSSSDNDEDFLNFDKPVQKEG